MQEITQIRKNKICLLDYDYKQDIKNRVMLSSLSELEIEVLEEILYSSIKTSLSRLSKDLKIEEKKLLSILKKIEKTDLLIIDGQIITIDKKMRKYFEFEYQRFEENFKPDLLFISNLLHKIPIHILPIWYSIPKSSNNIFVSIIDKYLFTPQMFQRHLENIECENATFLGIVEDVYNSENFEVESSFLQKKYELEKETYLEIILLLEFNLLCFLSYKKTDHGYVEILTPFHEYKEYLKYFNETITTSIKDTKRLIKKRNSDFGFVQDLSSALIMAKNSISKTKIEEMLKKEISIDDPDIIVTKPYIDSIINKLLKLKFLKQKKDFLQITPSAKKWLEFDLENKALHLYYHPLNTFDEEEPFKDLINEKSIREAEKSIIRVLDSSWVYFDDFAKGILSPITDEHIVKITNIGKAYKYSINPYTKEEIAFIKKVIFGRLFETAIVSVGSLNAKDCFALTDLGKKLFDVT